MDWHLIHCLQFLLCFISNPGDHGSMPHECSDHISNMKGICKQRLVERKKQFAVCHSKKLVRLELVEREKGEGYPANFQRGKKKVKV